MKIVVTGGLGHIGSRLIRDLPALVGQVEEIRILDNLSTQRYSSLFGLGGDCVYRFQEMDMVADELEPALEGADLAVHLAAVTDATASVADPTAVEAVNFQATERLAAACAGMQCRMIMASTTSIYGTQESYVDEDCSPEELLPQSPYAKSKFREEELLRRMAAGEGLKALIFRFGTIAGTSPGMRFHTAVNKFCWQAVMGQAATVWETAYDQKRPYLALEDAVAAIAHFAQSPDAFDGRLYNVVTANRTVRQICDAIREDCPDLRIEFVKSQIMNQLSYEVGASKIEQTGFRYGGSIEKSIRDTIGLLKPGGV